MLIQIDLQEFDPPAGTACIEGQEDQTFVGWLGLLHVISELAALPVKS